MPQAGRVLFFILTWVANIDGMVGGVLLRGSSWPVYIHVSSDGLSSRTRTISNANKEAEATKIYLSAYAALQIYTRNTTSHPFPHDLSPKRL